MSYEKQFWEHEPSPEDDREDITKYLQKEAKVLRERNAKIIADISVLLHELDCQSARQKDLYSDETKQIIEQYKPLKP